MRWQAYDEGGLICSSCLGRKPRPGSTPGAGGRPRIFRPVGADEGQASRLREVFGEENPPICEVCLEGRRDDADGWLADQVEQYRDARWEPKAAVQKVLEMIDDYRRDALVQDAIDSDSDDPDRHEAVDPDLRIELALLDVLAVRLELELLRIAPERLEEIDTPEWHERVLHEGNLRQEFWHRLSRLHRIYSEVGGAGDASPPPDEA